MQKLRIGAGIVLCLTGIALIDQNRWLTGLIAFSCGFLLMMYSKRRR